MKSAPLGFLLLALPAAASAARLAGPISFAPKTFTLPELPVNLAAPSFAPMIPENLVLPPNYFAVPVVPDAKPVAVERAYVQAAAAPALGQPAVTKISDRTDVLSLASEGKHRFDGTSYYQRGEEPPLARLKNVGLTDISGGAISQELNTYRAPKKARVKEPEEIDLSEMKPAAALAELEKRFPKHDFKALVQEALENLPDDGRAIGKPHFTNLTRVGKKWQVSLQCQFKQGRDTAGDFDATYELDKDGGYSLVDTNANY